MVGSLTLGAVPSILDHAPLTRGGESNRLHVTKSAPCPPPSLSLVIPAYNEAARISDTVSAVLAFLAAQPYPTELILVDDGSVDGTADLSRAALTGTVATKIVTIPHSGKAVAVRAGMAAATLDQVAFCDADLATPLSFVNELRRALADGADIAIGSRQGVGARRLGEPFYRHVMGRVFNWLVRGLVLPGIQDTQCGFKLFRRDVAEEILGRALLYAVPHRLAGPRVTAFDVELLAIARHLGYRIAIIPVVWTYGERSKVHPLRDTWQNGRDVFQVRLNLWRGRYH